MLSVAVLTDHSFRSQRKGRIHWLAEAIAAGPDVELSFITTPLSAFSTIRRDYHLYRHATLFALPSVYEGFGMPAVKAMGFGVPAIVSAIAALPEITLGRASYVEHPKRVGSWVGYIEHHLNRQFDLSDTAQLVRSTYSPQTVARKILEQFL